MSLADKAFDFFVATIGKRLMTIIVVVVIVFSVLWTMYSFLWSGTRHAADVIYDKSIALCVEASDTVATIATTDNAQIYEMMSARFEVLYWGSLVVIESDGVEAAMVDFRQLITKDYDILSFNQMNSAVNKRALRSAALRVSMACHDMLQLSVFSQIMNWLRTSEKLKRS